MEDDTDELAQAQQLHEASVHARQRAADARRLALEISRRRELVVSRDAASRARHTPEVWSSNAASASRETLHRGVGLSLRLVGESLQETHLALEQEARNLEGAASAYRRQADAVVEAVQTMRSVSSTSAPG